MRSHLEQPDLLSPSLSASDDVAEVSEPWNPSTLLYLAFFFGLPAGGVLAALNYRRLGHPQRVTPTLLLAVVGSLALMGMSATLYLAKSGLLADEGSRRLLRIGIQGLSLGATYLLSREQHRLYRTAMLAQKKPGSLLVPGAIAAILSMALTLGGSVVLLTLLGSPDGKP